MNDKITAVTANLNSILVRLDWIREQNYNDPDAVDLMGDVAEWVCEIGEAIEAIEKSLTPALSKGERVERSIEGWERDEVSGEERRTPDFSKGERVGRVIEGWGRDEVSGEESQTPDFGKGESGGQKVGTENNTRLANDGMQDSDKLQ